MGIIRLTYLAAIFGIALMASALSLVLNQFHGQYARQLADNEQISLQTETQEVALSVAIYFEMISRIADAMIATYQKQHNDAALEIMTRTVPDIIKWRIVTEDMTQPIRDDTAPCGYACLGFARDNRSAPEIEMHWPGGDNAVIALGRPFTHADGRRASLVLQINAEVLKQILGRRGVKTRDLIEIRQLVDGNDSPILYTNNRSQLQDAIVARAKIPSTLWEVVMWRAATRTDTGLNDLITTALGTAALLYLIVFYLYSVFLKRYLYEDITQFVSTAAELAAGKPVYGSKTRLLEFKDAFELLNEYFSVNTMDKLMQLNDSDEHRADMDSTDDIVDEDLMLTSSVLDK